MGQLNSKVGRHRRKAAPLSSSSNKLTASRQSLLFTVQVILIATLFVFLGNQILQRIGISLTGTEPMNSESGITSESPLPSPPASKPVVTPSTAQPSQIPTSIAPSSPTIQLQSSPQSGLVYNVHQSTNLPQSENLQAIVDEVVNLAEQRGLPINALSISLIDLKANSYAAYQDQALRFPASVSKLFWLVELYAWIEKGLLPAEYGQYDLNTCKTDVCRMIQESDNEAASRVVDALTGTQSGQALQGETFENWLLQRKLLNRFFQAAGYDDIDISQKNFPIAYLGLDHPQGADLMMRGDPANPIRNKVTTAQAARLMYEIISGQAVSAVASQHMAELLTRYDLATGVWLNKEYNPIQGFLGESLPPDVYFASKVGWTSESRQEVAYIDSKDSKAQYILVIFADHPAYGDDWKIFPEISRLVFDRMTHLLK